MRDSNPLSSPPLFSLVLYNIIVNSNLIGHPPIPENLLSSKRGGGAVACSAVVSLYPLYNASAGDEHFTIPLHAHLYIAII